MVPWRKLCMEVFPGTYTTKAFQHSCLAYFVLHQERHESDPQHPDNLKKKKKKKKKRKRGGRSNRSPTPPPSSGGIEGVVDDVVNAATQLKSIAWKKEPLLEYILTLPLCSDELLQIILEWERETKKRIPAGDVNKATKFKMIFAWKMEFERELDGDSYFPVLFESFAKYSMSK